MPFNLIRSKKIMPGEGACLLLDTSGSMDLIDNPASGRRRIDRLAEILQGVLSQTRIGRLVTFDSYIREIPLGQSIALTEPDGGTALDLAIDYVREGDFVPDQLIIMSDGEPNDMEDAFQAMLQLQQAKPCVVHTRYCGPDRDRAAIAFMRELARLGMAGSTSQTVDLNDPVLITRQVVGLLTHGR